ncbi:MAG: 2-dehydro-3-deoxy-D-gluconate 5-dehydrogenase KduD [Oscillospiraceae bacterium]|jgi:2-deoxy-D-gluconate 3-dehydrogenase|nr:2-dehydro-3-deoxy-D-gluconate 5-dehydrogenase KduD [Oscillospiraceae bacterium]
MQILDQFRLDGKIAIVTGANTGLGQGMCAALAEAGARVAGAARRDCAETAALLPPEQFVPILADLSDPGAPAQILLETLAAFGRVDILVNNAGIIRRSDLPDFTERDWDDVLQVNLKALFLLSQAAARQFLAQGGGGKIINIASMLSFQGGIRVPSYTASKSGVRGLTMEMANELAPHGIQVNAIAPGYMVTNNTAQLRADEKRNAEILARIPAGRWGTPADLGGACVFLASAASDYVSGVTLPVDGGWLGR